MQPPRMSTQAPNFSVSIGQASGFGGVTTCGAGVGGVTTGGVGVGVGGGHGDGGGHSVDAGHGVADVTTGGVLWVGGLMVGGFMGRLGVDGGGLTVGGFLGGFGGLTAGD